MIGVPRSRGGANLLVAAGLCAMVLALFGWLATMIVSSIASQPNSTEDLTAVWTISGPTPLGGSTTIAVPDGQTLVAFLVGTQLRGTAGTTTGSCSATSAGMKVALGWPVQINRSLTGVLADGQETVAIAGWTNRQGSVANVQIICTSADSTVDHFVAVSTRTGIVQRDPWFQPWAPLVVAALGATSAVIGIVICVLKWHASPYSGIYSATIRRG